LKNCIFCFWLFVGGRFARSDLRMRLCWICMWLCFS